MKYFLIFALLIIGCSKPDTSCYDIDGIYRLTETRDYGKVICKYDTSFYYSYEIKDGIAVVTEYQQGYESFVRSFMLNCNYVFFAMQDSFYYGTPISYGVLVRK